MECGFAVLLLLSFSSAQRVKQTATLLKRALPLAHTLKHFAAHCLLQMKASSDPSFRPSVTHHS
jgi:hypothetical protein